MSFNYIENDDAVFAVYYLDNGASYWHVTQNVAYNSPLAWAFFMTGGGNAYVGESGVLFVWAVRRRGVPVVRHVFC